MIELGKFNVLEVFRRSPHGVYLMDEDGLEVLLPNKFVPENIQIDDNMEVFVFKDSEDRLTATTQKPMILLNEFACLKVREVNQVGAFLDWGLDKDLFVPYAEQSRKMEKNQKYIVYLFSDLKTNRLVASSKLGQFLSTEKPDLERGQEVDLLIGRPTEIGINAIINNKFRGLIYKNEVFKVLELGDRMKGYVKNIREDYKIDLSLEPLGHLSIEPHAEKLLELIKKSQGKLKLTDNSNPEMIMRVAQMSKKAFKRAAGSLYKQRLIEIKEDGIYLVEKK